MTAAELACRWRFWAADLRRGAPIARHLADVRRAFADPVRAAEAAASRLRGLLAHAAATTSFYRPWAGCRELAAFPVVRKRAIQEDPEAFTSSTVERERLLTVSTSGSYGAPLRLRWTPDTYARRRAELLHFGSWVGFRIGAPFAQVTVDPSGTRRLPAFNGHLLDPSVIDEAWLEGARALLKRERVAFVVGYPSSIRPLAEFCRARGDAPADFRLRGVVASSEALLPGAREAIVAAFGCRVLDRYGANELGILAQECPEGASHHLNVAGHVVELLAREGDAPARPGEPGRVVVTDLFSRAMPLIRYDTGDLAVAAEGACPCGRPGPRLARVEGRQVEEVRDPDGALVNPLAIGGCPKDLEGIVQFQFVQRAPDRYLVRLHALPSFRDEPALRDRFRRLLGPRAALEVEYVAGIPPLPSGKRPYILSELPRRAR